MKKVDYIALLMRAWDIVWHHKYLWWLGSIIAIGGILLNVLLLPQEVMETGLTALGVNSSKYLVWQNAIALLGIGVVFLRLWSTASLALGVADIEGRRSLKSASAVFRSGWLYAGKTLLLYLIVNTALFLVFAVLSIPVELLFGWNANVLGGLTLIGAFIIFVPLLVLAYFIQRFGIFYIVYSGIGVRSSIESAYQLFQKKMKESLVTGVILVLPYLITFILLTFVAAVLMLVLVIPGLIFYSMFSMLGIVLVLGIYLLLFGSFAALCLSVVEAYRQTAWALYFHRIASIRVEMPVDVAQEQEVIEEEKATSPQGV